MYEHEAIYNSPPGVELSTESSIAEFRSEAIYEGKFSKKVGDKVQSWDINLDTLRYWANTGNLMIQLGVEIPMPMKHTDEPDKKRAEVKRFEVAKDSKGRDALFYHWSFVDGLDDETKAALKSANTSIYVPAEYRHSPTGQVFDFPIRHIAFTNYAVVPDLDKHTPIAASYTEETRDMNVRDIAKKLSIEFDDKTSDEDIAQMIIDFKAKPEETPPEETPPEETPPEETPVPLAAGFVSMACESRDAKIDALVSSGHVTPACAKKLKAQFATKEHIALAMSEDGTFSDGFDSTLEALKSNTALKLGEKTGSQTLLKEEENPVLLDAKRRAKAAAR